MRDAWVAAGLLLLSNSFMTTAWYGHLRVRSAPIWAASPSELGHRAL
jgi:uncharacterized protein (DUF486 family)